MGSRYPLDKLNNAKKGAKMEMTEDQKVAFVKNYYAEMKAGIKRMRDTAEATPPGELKEKRLKMVEECEATRIWFRDKWGFSD